MGAFVPRACSTRSIRPHADNRLHPRQGASFDHGRIHRRALGRSLGRLTCKVHCLSDARGRPAAFHLTPGEAADCKAYDNLIDLLERKSDARLADKTYDTDAICAHLKRRGIKAVIPSKSNRNVPIPHNKRLYQERNCIERASGHLKVNRAIATRSTRRKLPRHVVPGVNPILAQICPRRLIQLKSRVGNSHHYARTRADQVRTPIYDQ